MVKPAFDRLPIEIWVSDRKLGATADCLCIYHGSPAECSQFVDALSELEVEDAPARRTLTFAPCSRKSPVGKLTFSFVAPTEALRVMHIRRENEAVIIQVTRDGLSLLRNAFSSWQEGAEDFGIASRHSSLAARQLGKLDRESSEIWFWGPRYTGP